MFHCDTFIERKSCIRFSYRFKPFILIHYSISLLKPFNMVPQIHHNNSLYFNVPNETRHQNESNDVQHIYIHTYVPIIQTCIHNYIPIQLFVVWFLTVWLYSCEL